MKITILYVEDEEEIRNNTKRPLEYLCDKLILAQDGKEGLELYKQYDPDIIVSDIKMPNMNGIDMTKAIKEINPNQYIIFTTAHSESSFFMEAIDMQVDGYILKPIDYELLENKIENIKEQIDIKLKNKQQEKEIQQQKLNILEQSKNAQMGDIIGNIAHQWRQPLSVISTAATGIQIKKQLGMISDDEENSLLESIDKNAQFLSKTIDIFRNYIKEKRETKTVILQTRVNLAISIVEASLKNNNIKIINNINKIDDIQIFIVVGELTQVLINIFNNAKDILSEQNKKDKWIKIDLERRENKAIITIEDNGGGIPDNLISKIFDPYFTTKHQSQGTGLGLYISKDIIEKHLHGKLSVKNSQNGAIFKIELPLSSIK